MCRSAVIICGGRGSRLMPYTNSIPKALLPVGNYPILEIIIGQLKYYGFTSITLSVFYMAESIIKYFGNGEKWDVQISYSTEKFPLGTAGPLKILNNLPDDFLVANCDILTSLNFEVFFQNHLLNNNLFTIAGFKKKYDIKYGILEINSDDQLIKLEEKPETLLTNSGIYVLNKKILELIPENKMYGIDDLIHYMLRNSMKISVYPFIGSWQDIGCVKEYKKVIYDFQFQNIMPVLNNQIAY